MAETRDRRAPERDGGPPESIARALAATDPQKLRALAHRLGELGLAERAVKTCFGARCVAHAIRRPPAPGSDAWPPAAVLPRMFVARHATPVAVARHRLGDTLEELEALGLLVRDPETVRATVTLLPVGESLVVCGPLPDDSTFHLIGALPKRRVEAWLDVGTGNAIVPLARRGLARRVLASDVDREAVAFGRLGIELSAAIEVELRVGDLFEAAPAGTKWPLVSFNAPIPDARHGDLLDRFWHRAREAVAPQGEVVVHSQQPTHDYPACLDLPGSTLAVRYTPEGVTPAFGVTVWRPSGRQCRELAIANLTLERPHVSREHFDLGT